MSQLKNLSKIVSKINGVYSVSTIDGRAIR